LDAHAYLETTKEHLHAHFHARYDKPLLAPAAPIASTFEMNSSPQKVDFTYLPTETFLRHSWMKFKSTSSSLMRILTLVTHCNGGLVGIHSSLTSLVLHGIFFQFPVSSQLISSHYSVA